MEKRCVSISLFTKGLDLIVVLQFQDEEMSFAENLSFASIEVVPERFIQKDNYHGIGYNPLNPTAALHTKVKQSTSVKGRTKTGSRLSFMGQVIMIAYLFCDNFTAVVSLIGAGLSRHQELTIRIDRSAPNTGPQRQK